MFRFLAIFLVAVPAWAGFVFPADTTSKIVTVRMYATDGTPKTALAYTDMTIAYVRNEDATDVDVTEATMTAGTWVSGGWIEVDATNSPGVYQFGTVDLSLAAGAESVEYTFAATGAFTRGLTIQIVDYDPYDAVRLGLTALPNAAADAAGGLPISDAGGFDIDSLSTFDPGTTPVELLDSGGSAGTSAAELAVDVWEHVITGSWPNGSAARFLRNAASVVLEEGTAQSGTANTIVLEFGDVTVDGQFVHSVIIIISGTGAIQEAIITDSVASTDTLTITPAWPVANPASDSGYVILPGLTHAQTVAGGYAGGAVWVASGSVGTPGVRLFVNGVITNPVDNIADARTIADALNLQVFHCLPGSSITLAQAFEGFEFIGEGYSVALGGQPITGTIICAANISGTATSTVSTGILRPRFERCTFNATTLPPCRANSSSGFVGPITFGSAGDFDFIGCTSLQAGAAMPLFDLGAAVGASNVQVRDWWGGIEFDNVQAGDIMSMEGQGGVIDVDGTGGTINVRGIFERVDDSSGALVAIDQIAMVNRASLEGYRDGVWINTNGTNTGVIAYLDGTETRPSDGIANATIISDLIGDDGLQTFSLYKGASIALAQTYTRYVFTGKGGTIALGGQDVGFCTFESSNISGVSTGAGRTFWRACRINGGTYNDFSMNDCSLNGTIILAEADEYAMRNCNATEDAISPILDFGAAVASTTMQMDWWSGPVEIQNLGQTGTDSISILGRGDVTLNANCVGGTITLIGEINLTNLGSGITVNQTKSGETKEDIAAEVDVVLTAAHGAGAWSSSGGGSLTLNYTLTLEDLVTPVDDALIEVFTEAAMTNITASQRTDAFGKCTFFLDAGTYYLRRTKGGFNFANPQIATVLP